MSCGFASWNCAVFGDAPLPACPTCHAESQGREMEVVPTLSTFDSGAAACAIQIAQFSANAIPKLRKAGIRFTSDEAIDQVLEHFLAAGLRLRVEITRHRGVRNRGQ